MVPYRARRCSRGLLFASLGSAAIHLWLIANIAIQVAPEESHSGIAQKKLQVLVTGHAVERKKELVRNQAAPPAPPRHIPTRIDSRGAPAADLAPTIVENPVMPSGMPADVVEKISDAELVASAGMAGEVRVKPQSERGTARIGADEVRSYRIALATTARRFKVYPPMASARGIGGRSEVVVVLMPAGGAEVSLRGSSGEPLLDQAALDMVRQAVQTVERPVALRSHRMELMLPVEFVPGS